MRKRCAYCGSAEATTVDHVIPRALYPESRRASRVQRITVPACEPCNRSWVDDEPHFRNVLLISGERTPVVDELWYGKARRSFDQVDGIRRLRDIAHRLVPVLIDAAQRHKVYPADDPRVMRVLRKIIRGVSHHHKVLTGVSDEQLWADVQRFAVPPEFLTEMRLAHADADIIEYRWAIFRGDEFLHSCWLLKFFERTPFIGVVFHSAEAMLASAGSATSQPAS